MARASHRDIYISHLLGIYKAITEQICSEIEEVQHDRGRCSSDVKEALIHVIEDKFEHIHYREDGQND